MDNNEFNNMLQIWRASPCVFIEEYLGIKLLNYQRLLVDKAIYLSNGSYVVPLYPKHDKFPGHSRKKDVDFMVD